MNNVYTRHTSSCLCVGSATRPTGVCLAPLGPLQAAFKPAKGKFVSHPNHLLK
ncbi:hypothetical protein PEC301879_34080 [Pectobacterium carotovorum subsp. carotovorum]|nr:hypothetical protein PEC301879_34080 [Pectobacterium carotovorum subsp. carotovorum]